MTIQTFNAVIARTNILLGEEMGEEVAQAFFLEPIRYEGVNELFMAWNAFHSRPDFKEYMDLWFMGGDLSTLPDLPASSSHEAATDQQEEHDDGEGNGGDEVPEDEATEEAPEVPEVQACPDGEDRPAEEAGCAGVR